MRRRRGRRRVIRRAICRYSRAARARGRAPDSTSTRGPTRRASRILVARLDSTSSWSAASGCGLVSARFHLEEEVRRVATEDHRVRRVTAHGPAVREQEIELVGRARWSPGDREPTLAACGRRALAQRADRRINQDRTDAAQSRGGARNCRYRRGAVRCPGARPTGRAPEPRHWLGVGSRCRRRGSRSRRRRRPGPLRWAAAGTVAVTWTMRVACAMRRDAGG